MPTRLFRRCAHPGRSRACAPRQRQFAATRLAEQGIAMSMLTNIVRARSAPFAENAFLRRQFVTLRRSVRHPRCTPTDRAFLVLLASRIQA